ncbi:MAG: DUF1003 domain-containing protein [Acetobacteraceae bacterium]
MNGAAVYARFRGSAWFVLFLCAFLSGWFALNLVPGLPHFDRPGYGVLNVILSSEASLSVALLIMATEKQDRVQRKQLEYMLHMMEAMRLRLAVQKDALAGSAADPH